ncbi:MAG: transketolase [Acidobacteriota bacterium]
MSENIERWRTVAQQLRIDSIRATTEAGSGHPTSSMSAADLMAVLLCNHLRYDFKVARHPNNDHLIFSKGHAAPLLYAIYKAAGAITDEELMSLRKLGSRLQGHPVPTLPWVEVATGSLGQGLPVGVGMALAGKHLDRLSYRIWVLLGDSEMSEGSIWEAMAQASHYKLDNLIGILDVNRLGQRGETALGWNIAAYATRAQAFGWRTIEIDGHDLNAIDRAYYQASEPRGIPTLIIAKTVKGKGVSFIEDKEGWHGKPLSREQAAEAIKELGNQAAVTVTPNRPPTYEVPTMANIKRVKLPAYQGEVLVATRKAYGEALKAIGAAWPDIVVLDAEVSNSTFAEDFAKAFPKRFFEQYIAEQQMVAGAVGLSVCGKVPFASTFAAFLTRAYDFIRMAAVSHANIKLCGSHAGVSIGEDGPSQMALEDLAMMRAVWGSTVLYPCDANQTAALVVAMVQQSGIVYMRTTREKTPLLYQPDEEFHIGGSKVLRHSDNDKATVVAAGITVHEALKAAHQLAQEGIAVRVIDAYSIKPIDTTTLYQAARDTNGKIVVVEDHWSEGGLGDAVLAAFAGSSTLPPRIIKLAVRDMPGSGTPEQLLDAAGISASHIVKAVRSF